MFFQIIFFLMVIVLIVMSFIYLRRQTHINFDIRYTVISRIIMAVLISIVFLENVNQSTLIKRINTDVSTYIKDAGNNLMTMIDTKTKEISGTLKDISDDLNNIKKQTDNISESNNSISKQIDKAKNDINSHVNNVSISIINEILKQLFEFYSSQQHPEVKTIW